MKKLTFTAASLALAISSSFAQGVFNFDNTSDYTGAANAFTLVIGPFSAPGEGAVGQVVGSDPTFATPNYDISFLYQLGTANAGAALSPDLFIAAGATNSTLQGGFDAVTGDAVDAGGLYGLGTAIIPSSTDGTLITVEAISWYDPTGTTTFAQDEASARNVGAGPLVAIRLAHGTDLNVADMSTTPGFLVGIDPEPNTFALSGLAAGALMIFRRKK